LGALIFVGIFASMSTTHVMAAGPLLRCHGPRSAVLLPYFERVIPPTILVALSLGAVVTLTLLRDLVRNGPTLFLWHLPVCGLLVLAVSGTWQGWPWPVRLVLNASWIACQAVLVVLFLKGILVVQFP
jgi:hypothetical protein